MVQHHYIQSEGFSSRGHESMLLYKFHLSSHFTCLLWIRSLLFLKLKGFSKIPAGMMQLNSTVFSKSTNKDTSRSSWPAMTATWSWYVPLKILQRVPISLYIPQQIIDIKKKTTEKHTLYNMTKFSDYILCKQTQYSHKHLNSCLFLTKATPASLPSIPRAPSCLFSRHGSNLLMISRQCSLVTFVICKSSKNEALTSNHSFS